MSQDDVEALGRIATTLMRVVMRMPDPLPRFFLDALEKEVPELHHEIHIAQQRSVPFLNLHEARRTTTTGMMMAGPRFSAVLITAETDDGQLICWPHFMIDRLTLHDLDLLDTSLSDWLTIVRNQKRAATAPSRKVERFIEFQTEVTSKGEEELL